MSIYLPQQSICSAIHSVEDNDGNDIHLVTAGTSDQLRGSSNGNEIIIIAVL